MIRLKSEDINQIDNIIFELNEKPFPNVKIQSKIIAKKITEKANESDTIESCDSVINMENSDKSMKQHEKNEVGHSLAIQQQPKKPKLEDTIKGERNEVGDINLVEEVEKLKKERSCVVCFDRQKVVMFMPCSHLAACVECSVAMSTCPICRQKIEATIRTYI